MRRLPVQTTHFDRGKNGSRITPDPHLSFAVTPGRTARSRCQATCGSRPASLLAQAPPRRDMIFSLG